MKPIRQYLGLVLLFLTGISWAQCDYSLNNKVIEQIDTNAVYVRDFRVKLKEGTPRKPTPLAKYALYMEHGNLYQLNYLHDSLLPGKAIFHLYYKNVLLESNYDVKSNLSKENLTYYCHSSGTYRLYVSFKEAQKGCVAVVLSKIKLESVVEDTLSDKMEVLYIGIDNELEVSNLDCNIDSIEFKISQGELIEEKGKLFARVFEPGERTIEMIIRDSSGEVKRTIQTPFLARYIPTPTVTLNGKRDGYINKSTLLIHNQLQLHFISGIDDANFEITEFTISSERDGIDGIPSLGNRLSSAQMQFLDELSPGDRFYIKNVEIQGPQNVEFNVDVLEYIIE